MALVGQLLKPDVQYRLTGKLPAVNGAQEDKWQALLESGRMPEDANSNPQFMKFLCRQLESVAINTVMQAARKTIPQDGIFSGGFAGSMYQGLADEEYSKMIAQRGGFGLGDALFEQVYGRKAYAREAEMTARRNGLQSTVQQADTVADRAQKGPQANPVRSDN